MEVKAIVTHLPPHHLDDILAVGVLKTIYPDAEVRYIHPQDERLKNLIEDTEVALVDVGGKYDPKKLNFDHHQNQLLPCSLIMVLKHFMPDKYEQMLSVPDLNVFLDIVDIKDRYGFSAARSKFELPFHNFYALLEQLLVSSTPEAVGKAWVSMVDSVLDAYRALEEVEKIDIDGTTWLYDPNGISAGKLFAVHPEARGVVQKNSMNPAHTSIVKNTRHPGHEEINLRHLAEKTGGNVVFAHQSGFMAVVDIPVEEVKNKLTGIQIQQQKDRMSYRR